MAITVSAIEALIGKYGAKVAEEQVNQSAPVVNMLDKVKEGGRVGVVNIKAGGIDSVMWLDDGDTLPAKASRDLAQVSYLPKALFAHGSIPRMAAHLAGGAGEGINLVLEELESVSAQLARRLADGIINGTQAVVTLTTAQANELGATGTDLTVTDHSRFRVGDVFERYSGTVLDETLRCVRVQIDEDGTSHTITFDRDILSDKGSANPAANDNIYPRGSYADAMVSLKDITAAGNLYGKAITADEWEGNLKDLSSSALDVQAMRDLYTKVCQRRGIPPSFTLSNSRNRQKYSDTLLDQRRYHSGKMDATGGLEIDFEGKPFKIDESCDSGDLHFVQKKDVKLHVFKDFADEADGGMKSASKRGHLLVDDTAFVYGFQRWGAYNLRVPRRNGTGTLTGIA